MEWQSGGRGRAERERKRVRKDGEKSQEGVRARGKQEGCKIGSFGDSIDKGSFREHVRPLFLLHTLSLSHTHLLSVSLFHSLTYSHTPSSRSSGAVWVWGSMRSDICTSTRTAGWWTNLIPTYTHLLYALTQHTLTVQDQTQTHSHTQPACGQKSTWVLWWEPFPCSKSRWTSTKVRIYLYLNLKQILYDHLSCCFCMLLMTYVCFQSWMLHKKCIMEMDYMYTAQECAKYWIYNLFMTQSQSRVSSVDMGIFCCICMCAAVPIAVPIKGDGIYFCLLSKPACFLSALLLFGRWKHYDTWHIHTNVCE